MDLRRIKQLLALMESHNLAEIEIVEGETKVRLKKDVGGGMEMTPTALTFAPAPAPAAPGSPPPAAAPKGQDLVEIKSPMVGTFYRSSAPEADPFVSEGDHITEDTVVCIIEAMKVMNEIKAEVAGEIVSILVENAQPVEFGQPLMLVRPTASES